MSEGDLLAFMFIIDQVTGLCCAVVDIWGPVCGLVARLRENEDPPRFLQKSQQLTSKNTNMLGQEAPVCPERWQ